MNCSDVRDQLSAYYDHELSADAQATMARHLSECEACAAELMAFSRVSREVRRMPQPTVPDTVWGRIAENLSPLNVSSTTVAPQITRRGTLAPGGPWRQLVLAASILLILSGGLWMARGVRNTGMNHPGKHEHGQEFVATMDHYLQQLTHDPIGAEQFLLSQYSGQTVAADKAVELVGYRPAVAAGLPQGYSLASTTVLKMPCCTCVKAVCRRQDGSTLVLFEHDDEKTEWFGERPSNMAICGDRECCLVELDSSIAATWKRGSRSVTAVGARNKEEVNLLVTWLDQKIGVSL
ncbi:MAG: zf-HC2 domain-containing protein [Planctomycetales bacterium]|nr:zf-HC2 domain-containing protein [Planctomycetales bacterium]